ncbi:hypothetical protein H9X90_05710 [Faecalicatena contorta]|uniref:hypothetical protein n=1 Tax=Faecalicatena contorta TaxID=39482 RepID=UPI00195F2A4B|nr:hypothetical protein [Faecalicatena contorta]MBM6685497.1 hypothetical protein [Faecalicatena contorta]MBM6710239.1 hypothetical protein [Faecalicatena contorta]
MFTVNDVKNFKHISDDLIDIVRNKLEMWPDYNERDKIERGEMDFEKDGVSYSYLYIDETSWDDEGKYQYQDITYQLVSYDSTNSKHSYPCDDNITDKFDLILTVPVTRSGSYFSEYTYYYDKPKLSLAQIEYIPEQIIPAHEDVKIMDIKD